jgi:DNA sulfur modification protein DndE
MSIKQFRLSGQSRDQLIRLKTRTGIPQWNILCRWAFCLSLKQSTPPTPVDIPSDSNVELTWQVFGGEAQELYLALLKERCERDGLGTSDDVLLRQSACTCTAASATWRPRRQSAQLPIWSAWPWMIEERLWPRSESLTTVRSCSIAGRLSRIDTTTHVRTPLVGCAVGERSIRWVARESGAKRVIRSQRKRRRMMTRLASGVPSDQEADS